MNELNNNILKLLKQQEDINKKLDNIINERFKNLENWKKRQDKSLEIEINNSIFIYIKNNIKDYIIIDAEEIFPKYLRDPYTNKTITEFDGLYILTNNKQFNSIENIIDDYDYYLIIIESKQYFNYDKFMKKINQKDKLSKYIIESKENIPSASALRVYDNNSFWMKYLKIFNENVGLYIGAIEFGKNVKKEMKKIIKSSNKEFLYGYAILNGNRFNVIN